MSRNVPKTPSALVRRGSEVSLPEIHTGSTDTEKEATSPSWANSPQLSKLLHAQNGRDSFRRKAFGSPYSKFRVEMELMFPDTETNRWARGDLSGRFSNIYTPSPNSHARPPRRPTTKATHSSALATTPSHVGSHDIVRIANSGKKSLAAPAKRGLRPRTRKPTSLSETGKPNLAGAGLDAVEKPGRVLRIREKAPKLAGTRFDVPPKRPVKSRDSQSTQLYHPKTPPRNSLSGNIEKIKAEITSSVKNLYPMIFCFLPAAKVMQYSNFNPFSINPTLAAILTEKKLEALEKQGLSFSAQMRSSIDDPQLEEIFTPDNFRLNDLILQPGRRISNVRDAISKKQKHKKDILNMLDWVDYSVARVYESMSNVEEASSTSRMWQATVDS
jgi:hypothetical protein